MCPAVYSGTATACSWLSLSYNQPHFCISFERLQPDVSSSGSTSTAAAAATVCRRCSDKPLFVGVYPHLRRWRRCRTSTSSMISVLRFCNFNCKPAALPPLNNGRRYLCEGNVESGGVAGSQPDDHFCTFTHISNISTAVGKITLKMCHDNRNRVCVNGSMSVNQPNRVARPSNGAQEVEQYAHSSQPTLLPCCAGR